MGKKGSTGIIVMVSNSSWSLFNFRSGLIRKFLSHGLSVWVLAPRDHCTPALLDMGVSFGQLDVWPHGRHLLQELRLCWQLLRWYRLLRPNLILHYTIKPNIYGSVAAHCCGIPSIACVTGLGWLAQRGHRLRRGLAVLYALGLTYSREVWFLNPADKALFVSRGMVAAEKSVVFPGEGIDTGHFLPQGDEVPVGRQPVLMFAGRMLREKGLVELALAVRRLRADFPGLRVFLLGAIQTDHPGGLSMRQIRHWEAEGIFEFLGETDDVRPYLGRADGLVFPSYREGLARIVMEASSMALPVVVADSVGCAELVVEGVTGFLCRAGDVDSIEGAIRRLLALSVEERRAMGAAGRRHMQTFFGAEQVEEGYFNRIWRYFPALRSPQAISCS